MSLEKNKIIKLSDVITYIDKESGVVSGNYGQKTDLSADFGSSFAIPEFAVNEQGKITRASSKTITLPQLPSGFGSSSAAVYGVNGGSAFTIPSGGTWAVSGTSTGRGIWTCASYVAGGSVIQTSDQWFCVAIAVRIS